MINVIKPLMTDDQRELTDISKIKNAIFLAGPCPRSNYDEQDWRTEAIAILEKLDTGNNDFTINVINPTNKYFAHTDLESQTQWESEAMHYASVIFFNLNKSEDHPGFTTNFEIGEWFMKAPSSSIFVYKPKDNKFGANRYIELKCKHFGINVSSDLEESLRAAYNEIVKEESRIWFTSDTHFGQDRTLHLSKRPFIDVFEMDKNLISNWNKCIRKNDTVYHLGDFGASANYLNLLNYGAFYFIEGNYEREKYPEVVEDLAKLPNVRIYKTCLFTRFANDWFILQHEPLSPVGLNEKNVYDDPSYMHLFGHIHGRQMIKQNGLDVGVDAHGYKPVSLQDVYFFKEGLQKYYDEQVYCSKCTVNQN